MMCWNKENVFENVICKIVGILKILNILILELK